MNTEIKYAPIKLGIPYGNLQERVLSLLRLMGIFVNFENRVYTMKIKNSKFISEVIFCNSKEIARSVAEGVIDIGITGWDRVVDGGYERIVNKIATLEFGKKYDKAVEVVLFCKKGKNIALMQDRQTIKIFSEYPKITFDNIQGLFPGHILNIIYSSDNEFNVGTMKKNVFIYPLDGGTEQKIASGEGDLGVCITESGETIDSNKLKVISVLLESPVVIISKKINGLESIFSSAFSGALRAKNICLLKFNLDNEGLLSEAIDFLPTAKSPTKSLRLDGGLSIETEIPVDLFFDTYVQLCQIGARDIIKIPIDVAA